MVQKHASSQKFAAVLSLHCIFNGIQGLLSWNIWQNVKSTWIPSRWPTMQGDEKLLQDFTTEQWKTFFACMQTSPRSVELHPNPPSTVLLKNTASGALPKTRIGKSKYYLTGMPNCAAHRTAFWICQLPGNLSATLSQLAKKQKESWPASSSDSKWNPYQWNYNQGGKHLARNRDCFPPNLSSIR